MAARFSEQVPTMELAAAIHQKHYRGSVDGDQGDVAAAAGRSATVAAGTLK
ncbi:hypothetical protein ABT112_05070 [Streptomyces sp. NPDC002055]|uniref:hypothetical protein n=1 Tax=Streptomyces sp. NPDC002055 TaxID=3154534 RepID=UPI0033181A2E